MKIAAVLTLAAMLAAGSATTASAFPVQGPADAERFAAQGGTTIEDVVHDRCHGQSSGTAHPDCGTATGGPVGGLF